MYSSENRSKTIVVAGLGNPGRQYSYTRHNIGFITVERFAERHGISFRPSKFDALIGDGMISGRKVLVVEPQTYMNLSGNAIAPIVDYYKIDIANLLVIYDDIDIPLGMIRIRPSGSAGTHNGMRSVISMLGTDGFPRIRIGMGQEHMSDLVDFVIGKITDSEAEVLRKSVDTAADAVGCFIESGIERTMNQYNPVRHKDE
ncbi:MAG: aminoacyl-tRNA hydrolase [Eubacterium sp.]|jgi:PTH1 family peptidyl-tRNA hydrolase